MKRPIVSTLLFSGTLIWCLLIVAAPLSQSLPSLRAEGAAVYRLFHLVCHQYESHSLHIGGWQLGVCTRCTAIYSGFLLAVVLVWTRGFGTIRAYFPAWILALLPMAIDAGLDMSGVHASTAATRLLTGGWFGLIGGVLLVPLFIQGCSELFPPTMNRQEANHAAKT